MAMANEMALSFNCGGTVGDSRKHYFCWSLRNPLKQQTCTSLLSRSDGTLNRARGLFWSHMHSIWLELKDADTPLKVVL